MARPSNLQVATAKRELSEKQLAYVIWQATPIGLRSPETLDEFCLAIGIGKTTAWRWGKTPQIAEAIRFVVVQNAGEPSQVIKILDMVHEMALDAEISQTARMRAAEVWLKATGVLTVFSRKLDVLDVLDVLDDEDSFTDFSDEALEAMRSQARATEQELEAIQTARNKLNEVVPEVRELVSS